MRVVIQRVIQASVEIDNKIKGEIGGGFMILLGIEETDGNDDIDWLVNKIANLRIFNDDKNVMNRSIIDEGKNCLVVSQFTLFASYKKGNRPSYIRSAKPSISKPLYENFINKLSVKLSKKIQTGTFGADMKIRLINDGPVTIIMDTKNKE